MLDPDADTEMGRGGGGGDFWGAPPPPSHMGSHKLSWSGAMFDHVCGQMDMDVLSQEQCSIMYVDRIFY